MGDLFESDLVPREPRRRPTEADFLPPAARPVAAAEAHDGEPFPDAPPTPDDDAWCSAERDETILPDARPRTTTSPGDPRARRLPAQARRPVREEMPRADDDAQAARMRETVLVIGRPRPKRDEAPGVWTRRAHKSIFDILARENERAARRAERTAAAGKGRKRHG